MVFFVAHFSRQCISELQNCGVKTLLQKRVHLLRHLLNVDRYPKNTMPPREKQHSKMPPTTIQAKPRRSALVGHSLDFAAHRLWTQQPGPPSTSGQSASF